MKTRGRRFPRVELAACAVGVFACAGCAVGPDYRSPAPPKASAYTAAPLPAATASAPVTHGEAQRIAEGKPADARWWRTFDSDKLNTLVEQALAANPTLAAAEAALRQARETYAARSGATTLPQVDASLGAQRQRFNPAALGQGGGAREFSLDTAALNARYNLDLAGANRRALEALAARTDYQRFRLEGARVTLAANVVLAAVAQAQASAQLEAHAAILQTKEAQLAITRRRLALGNASADDVRADELSLAQARAALPPLQARLDQTRHLLATLAGQPPGSDRMPAFALGDFTLPTDLPLVVPSGLARQRPDIRAAEALLHSAHAEYGAAAARLYPQLTLSASMGSQASNAGDLFSGPSAIWSLAGQLTQPIFNRGLPAEKRAAHAGFDAAAANYEQVVLDALRDVADTLRALEHDANALAAQAAASTAAEDTLRAVERQKSLGAASEFSVLAARQQAHSLRLNLSAAQAQRLTDTVRLFLAVGGGWRDPALPGAAVAAAR